MAVDFSPVGLCAAGLVQAALAVVYWSAVEPLGALFGANAVGCSVAATMLAESPRKGGWWLGLLVAATSVAAYVLSYVFDPAVLPSEQRAWFERLGALTVLGAMTFSVVALRELRRSPA